VSHMSSIEGRSIENMCGCGRGRGCGNGSGCGRGYGCDTMSSTLFERDNLGVAGLRAAFNCVRVWVRARPRAQRRFEQEPAGGKWCSMEAGMLGQMPLW